MTTVLSLKVKQAIDQALTKYPSDQKPSAVLYALTAAQEDNGGWLTEELMNAVAAYLAMPNIAVYEVAAFYSLFELSPIGKYKISVCASVSCFLCKGEDIIAHLKQRLNIDFDQTTPDGRFTLKKVECLAACGGAPAIQIGKVYYENVTPEKIDTILVELP